MMNSPYSYAEKMKNASYVELIRERENLLCFIREFEKAEMSGTCRDPSRVCCPSPEVQYQVYLEYLAALCSLMHKKYNQEYVFGGRSLKGESPV